MKMTLENEVKAVIVKWKKLIDYLKEEDDNRVSRIKSTIKSAKT